MSVDAPIPNQYRAPRGGFERAFLEWEELYGNRSYMLARLEMEEVTDQHPDMVEAWFLLGLAQLAARDLTRAGQTFDRVIELIEEGRRPSASLALQNFEEVSRLIHDGIEAKTVTSAPKEWRAWLENPEVLRSGGGIAQLASVASSPLGRSEPLLPIVPNEPLGTSRPVHSLSIDQVGTFVPVRVDTMRELLGRDADLRIETGQIVIIDENLRIGTPDIEIVEEDASDEGVAPSRPAIQSQPKPAASARSDFRPFGKKAAAAGAAGAAALGAGAAAAAAAAPKVQRPFQPAAKQSAFDTEQQGAPPAAEKLESAATSAVESGKTAEDPWVAWEHHVQDLIAHGKNTDAMRQIEEALARYPDSSKLMEMRADLLQRVGDTGEAVKAYMETYRRAVETGVRERADRAYREVTQLGRENADLLLEAASLAASVGSVAIAAGTAKAALDLYRRRNDRPRLYAALQRVQQWLPGDKAVENELHRLGRELSGSTGNAVERAAEIRRDAERLVADVRRQPGSDETIEGGSGGSGDALPRTAPPRRGGSETTSASRSVERPASVQESAPAPQEAPRRSPTMEELRERAMRNLEKNQSAPADGPDTVALSPALGFVIASVFVLLFTLASGTWFFGLIGLIASLQYEKTGKRLDESGIGLMRTAQGMFALSMLAGFIM